MIDKNSRDICYYNLKLKILAFSVEQLSKIPIISTLYLGDDYTNGYLWMIGHGY